MKPLRNDAALNTSQKDFLLLPVFRKFCLGFAGRIVTFSDCPSPEAGGNYIIVAMKPTFLLPLFHYEIH
jgi:hypothetical protein